MWQKSIEANVKKYFAFSFFSNFWFTIAIWILFIRAFNVTYTQIGVLEAASLIVILLLEIPSGVFSDLFGHKLTVFIAMLLWSIGNIVIGLGNGFYAFLIGYCILGITDAFRSGAESSLLYESLRKLKRQKEYLKVKSKIRRLTTLTVVTGALVGPVLFNINIRLPFLISAIFIFISSLIVLSMVEPYSKRKTTSLKKHYEHFVQSLKFSMSNKHISWLIVFGVILAIPMGIFVNLFSQPYLVKIGFSVLGVGGIFALIHGASGVIASFADKIEGKLKEKASLLSIILIQSIAFIIMSIVNAPIAAIAVIMLYIGRDYKQMILDAYMNRHIKPKNRATVLSISQFTIDLFAAIFVIIGGYIADVFSMNTAILLLGIATLILGIPHFLKRYANLKRMKHKGEKK